MSQDPLISIITPVLNGADFIGDLAHSLKLQDMESWEHIVVDGGSTDSTLSILKESYRDDPRLRLISEPGLGLYSSVINGLSVARGTVLGWQNADDLYVPWTFRSVADFYARSKSNWFTGLPGCWDEAGNLRYVRPYGWYPQSLIERGWFHLELLGFLQQESIFFTREAFDSLDGHDIEAVSNAALAGDFILWTRLAKLYKLDVLPTVLSGFRRHAGNRSHSQLDVYMREVRENGGKFLPAPIAAGCRRVFQLLSARSALKRVDQEDKDMMSSQSVDR